MTSWKSWPNLWQQRRIPGTPKRVVSQSWGFSRLSSVSDSIYAVRRIPISDSILRIRQRWDFTLSTVSATRACALPNTDCSPSPFLISLLNTSPTTRALFFGYRLQPFS